ncbi:hypothetical protein DRQ29_03620 [bacterium]|nr:MAG: hypothetical protein DRQ29_03620 [bacterium]
MKTFGIIISGIGYEDGTSVWDVAYLLREIERSSVKPIPLVPRESVERRIPGSRRKNAPTRDFLSETKLMVRGDVFYIDEFDHKELNGLIIPGGKGPVKILSSMIRDGTEALVIPEVRDYVAGMYVRGKPLAGFGYGAALIAFILKASISSIVTIGNDAEIVELLKRAGCDVIKVQPHEVVFDDENKIFSTPGTSPQTSLFRASLGIEMLVKEMANFKNISKKRRN